MQNTDDLLNRAKARASDPLRFLDSAAWVRPMPKIGAMATLTDIDNAEKLLGLPMPGIVRRMYMEIGNGNWGPYYGFYPIPVDDALPTEDDLVGFYLECISEERAKEEPLVKWPLRLVMLVGRGCVDYELCDFLKKPHAVYLLSGDSWLPNRPLVESLKVVADSIEERLEQWLRA